MTETLTSSNPPISTAAVQPATGHTIDTKHANPITQQIEPSTQSIQSVQSSLQNERAANTSVPHHVQPIQPIQPVQPAQPATVKPHGTTGTCTDILFPYFHIDIIVNPSC